MRKLKIKKINNKILEILPAVWFVISFVALLWLVLLNIKCSRVAIRHTCVIKAMDEYMSHIEICESKNMTYDECVSEYNIEKEFEQKQKECRDVENF